MPKNFVRLAAFLMAVLLAGCLTPRSETLVRHVLEPALSVEAGAPSGKTLAFRNIRAARPYGVRMMTRTEGMVLRQIGDAEWADLPAEVITRAMADALLASGCFDDVGEAKDLPGADYLMTGDLRVFHRDDTVNPARAVCEVRVEVRRLDRSLLWAGTLAEHEPLSGPGGAAFATAMSAAAGRVATSVAAAVAAALP